MVKRILRYVSGTLDHGIKIKATCSLNLYAFSDVWEATSLRVIRPQSFVLFLEKRILHGVQRNKVLRDISISLSQSPTIFWDNLSALYMSKSPVFHGRSKHIELHHL